LARRHHRRNHNQKEEIRFRINDFIKVPQIRLVGDNMEAVSEAAGKQVEADVYNTREVKSWARKMDLDLVEISPKAVPPVCKIIELRI